MNDLFLRHIRFFPLFQQNPKGIILIQCILYNFNSGFCFPFKKKLPYLTGKKNGGVWRDGSFYRNHKNGRFNASFTSTSDSKIKVSSLKLKGLTGLGHPWIKPIESWPEFYPSELVVELTNLIWKNMCSSQVGVIFPQMINIDEKIPPSQDVGLEKGESF